MNLVEVYRAKAKHYDLTSRFAPVPGYPQQAQRRRAVQALALCPGSFVVELACGTGANFDLLERLIGPDGRILGVDLTDAMLAQARRRIRDRGWRNIRLVHADAAEAELPGGTEAILATYAHCLMPHPDRVIAHAAAALSSGGRLAVLDLKLPEGTPRWMVEGGARAFARSATLREWAECRPWERLRAAVEGALPGASWRELCFGTAFLATATR